MSSTLAFPISVRIGINHPAKKNSRLLIQQARRDHGSPGTEIPSSQRVIPLSAMGPGCFGSTVADVKALRMPHLGQYSRVKPAVVMAMARPSDNPEKENPVFVVIDEFKVKVKDIDADYKKDITHGDIIVDLIKAKCPEATIIKKELAQMEHYNVADKLKEVKKAIEKGEKIDGVNLSVGTDCSYKNVSAWIGEEVTPENLAKKASDIRKKLPGSMKHQMVAMEAITELGVPIYIAAGNKSNDCFALEALAQGSINVGATDANGKKLKYSADNSLITYWSQGIFNLEAVKNQEGQVTGLTITGADNAEYPVENPPKINKYDEYLNLIKDPEKLKKSNNLLEYLKEEYGDAGCPEDNNAYKTASSLNESILGFDSYKLTRKVIGIMKKEKEAHQVSDEEFKDFFNFMEKYKEKLQHLEHLKDVNVELDEEGEPFFDFDSSGRRSYSFIQGTSVAAPNEMATGYNKKKSEKDLADLLDEKNTN